MEKYSSGSLTSSEMEDMMFLILPWQFPTIKNMHLPHFQQFQMLRIRALLWMSKNTSSKAYIMYFVFMIYSPVQQCK